MKSKYHIALLTTGAWLCISAAMLPAHAAPPVKLPDPIVDLIPGASGDAESSHDEIAIGQLMKIVELARSIGGGIVQLYNTVVNQAADLEKMREAQNGPKTIPLNNLLEEEAERAGGPGLNEMAKSALDGAPSSPEAVNEALAEFKRVFGLEESFALKDSDTLTKVFVANASAMGAISSSVAEVAYKRAGKSMDRLPSYIEAIETSPDLKTSVDINTRVMVELTQQVNESLRTQSATTSLVGMYFMILGGEVGKQSSLKGLEEYNR